MSFNERIDLSSRMDATITSFLRLLGFIVEHTGYEKYISEETKAKLRTVHNIPSVNFLRYQPDLFVWQNNRYFFVELKVMNSPIKYASRVKSLQEASGLNDLSSENIGAVETASIKNYENLRKIGVDILIIVYCTFNPNFFVAEWEENILRFFNDNVRIGAGNASFTPYTNVHLDKMRTLQNIFKSDFDINVNDEIIAEIKLQMKN
jgi:hypothetical protein